MFPFFFAAVSHTHTVTFSCFHMSNCQTLLDKLWMGLPIALSLGLGVRTDLVSRLWSMWFVVWSGKTLDTCNACSRGNGKVKWGDTEKASYSSNEKPGITELLNCSLNMRRYASACQ